MQLKEEVKSKFMGISLSTELEINVHSKPTPAFHLRIVSLFMKGLSAPHLTCAQAPQSPDTQVLLDTGHGVSKPEQTNSCKACQRDTMATNESDEGSSTRCATCVKAL